MTLEELITPQAATIGAAVFGGLITLQTTFIKWLVDRFDRLSTDLRQQATFTHQWLTDHETKDQRRHEENLKRFETIAINLAKIDHGNTIHH